MRTPINNIGIFDDIPEPRYTNKKERSMTELTPLALKLRTAYRNSDATGDALWNEMAGVVEAELAAPPAITGYGAPAWSSTSRRLHGV